MVAESLFCDELWLMMTTPTAERDDQALHEHENHHSCTVFSYSDVEYCEEAFRIFLGKEMAYAPENDYTKHVRGNCWIEKARFNAIQWFFKAQRRLNLLLETVFNAANYFDRFTSRKSCQVYQDWMFELLSVACLSTASKFNETTTPSLDQIQEGLENMFESRLIQRMELNLLKSLEWRLRPTTSYSCAELLTGSIVGVFRFKNKEHLVQAFNERVTDLLVNALVDSKFLKFWPSIIAMSALQHISDKFFTGDDRDWFCIGRFRALISPGQQGNLIECYEMMEEQLLDKACNFNNPSSPVTVLASNNTDWCGDLREFQAAEESSLLKMKKKKREGRRNEQAQDFILIDNIYSSVNE